MDRITLDHSKSTVQITLRAIGPSPPSRLTVPSPIKICDLRQLVAGASQLPLQDMRLVFRGKVLHDDKSDDPLLVQFQDGDTLIVAVKPKPPAKNIRNDFDEDEDEDDDDDLTFQLPRSASCWKRRLFVILHDKFHLPDMILMAIFSLSVKMWLVIAIWFILAPIAHHFDVGPLYILGTGFAVIFYNLGHRQPGDVSAYSVFNEDFRELPGTLNADRIDRDIRAGQL